MRSFGSPSATSVSLLSLLPPAVDTEAKNRRKEITNGSLDIWVQSKNYVESLRKPLPVTILCTDGDKRKTSGSGAGGREAMVSEARE